MKKLFLLSLFLLSLAACKERDADPNILPPATQTGANTGGALVDGKVWVATKKNISRGFSIGATRAEQDNNGNYIIGLELQNVNHKYSRIMIKAIIQNFELNKEYAIPFDKNLDKNLASYSDINSNYYVAKQPNYTGTLKLTRVDIPKNIVSGTFEFKAVDKDGNVINVTDGRFDKKFD